MKKTLAFLATLTIILSFLTACGGSNSKGQQATTSGIQTEPETTEAPVTTDSSKAADTPETTEETAVDAMALHELPTITTEASLSKSSVKDSYGNEYEGPYYDFCSWGKSSKDGEYITQSSMEYNVDGQYSYLTGTIFTRANQAEDHSIELLVYADDVLVFQSNPLTRKDKAMELAVDIGYCDVLRIASRSYEYSSNTNPGIILVNGAVCSDYDGELTEGAQIDPDLVDLTDLYVYGHHSTVLDNISAGVVADSYGNIYKDIYLELVSYGTPSGSDYDTQAYTDFVTDGKYNYFSGTFFTRAEQSEDYTIEFLIYADDELVYSSGMIDRGTKAVDFNVEINGCDMLRVMSRSLNYTSSGTNPGIILVNAAVSAEQN